MQSQVNLEQKENELYVWEEMIRNRAQTQDEGLQLAKQALAQPRGSKKTNLGSIVEDEEQEEEDEEQDEENDEAILRLVQEMDQIRADTERCVEEANQKFPEGANNWLQRTTDQQQSPPLCEKCMTKAHTHASQLEAEGIRSTEWKKT